MQGCTTTGYIGILRAAPPRNSVAEKLPSTSFPREEMALTAMAAINIVARTLRTIVDHLIPCVDSQNPSQPPCRRSIPEIYSPAALLLMGLNAHYKQIAQGVLSFSGVWHSRMPERRRNPDPSVANRSDSRFQNRNILRFFPKTELIGRVGTKLSIQLLILAQMLGEL